METCDTSIHLALAFDRKFITPFYVLLTSIFQNNRERPIVIHTIAAEVPPAELERITAFVAEHNAKIIFYNIDKSMVEDFVIPANTHFSPAAYYRLFFPALVPADIDKLLYIDTDTIVIGKLSQLYDINIGSYPLAAVLDDVIPSRPELGITEDGNCFNSGILLINLIEWRKQKISEKTIKFLNDFPHKIKWVDQDALNAVLINNWYEIDNRFNLTFYNIPKRLKKKEISGFLKDKVIIHYTTQHKPWQLGCANRLRFLYHHYFKLSPQSAQQLYVDIKVPSILKHTKIRLKEFLIDYTSLVP
jgi:lipopolysaccharide biosynthesis glycosyltransferase